MAYKFPYTRRFKKGDEYATLEAHNKGYSITYSRKGRVKSISTFYVKDGYNRPVGRMSALRELKRFNFEEIKTR